MKKKDLLELVSDIDILYRDNLNIPDTTTIGVEIEYTNLYKYTLIDIIHENFKGWNYQKDISVTDTSFGGEVVSPILDNTRKSWEELKSILCMLKDNGAGINDSCASHIHIGSSLINNDTLVYYYMLKMWSIFEREILQFSYGDKNYIRSGINLFSCPIKSDIVHYNYLIKKIIKEDDSFLTSLNGIYKLLGGCRNRCINLENIKESNVVDKNTIEFRSFNGTLDECIWQNNINFVVNFLNYFNKDYDKELIDYYFKRCNELEDNLNYYNIKKGMLLGSLIYDNELDYLYYLKQYTRGMKK